MAFEFGTNEHNVREFFPRYAEIDWREAYLHRNDEEKYSIWGECFDSLGEFCEELHQENCAIYLNDTDPDFDVIVVLDHRDDSGDWWFGRQTIGSDDFDFIVDKMASEVLLIQTKYPLKMVAEYVTRSLFSDLDKLNIDFK